MLRSNSENFALAKFRELDKNNSGTLEMNEIILFTEWVLENYRISDKEVSHEEIELTRANILRIYDHDRDQTLSFYEFKEVMDEVAVRMRLVEACEAKFNELDANQNGLIEREEMVQLTDWVLDSYEEVGCDAATRQTIRDTLMRKFDANKDGRLSQYEFSLLFEDVCSTHALIEKAESKFRELDVDGSGLLEGAEIEVSLPGTRSLAYVHLTVVGSRGLCAQDVSAEWKAAE